MKTLVVLTALAAFAIAAPSPGDYYNRYSPLPANLRRNKKSSENQRTQDITPALPAHLEPESPQPTAMAPTQARSLFKPVIVKKKSGYHLYRNSEEEQAAAHENCNKQVKVKLCDAMTPSKLAAMEKTGFMSKDDVEHSIKMAKEAVENLQRDLNTMENAPGNLIMNGNKAGLESDTELREDIEVARQALDHIHKNFDTLESVQLRADKQNLIKTEGKMAQWKDAMNNIQKHVEIAKNIEDSFQLQSKSAKNTEAENMNIDEMKSAASEQSALNLAPKGQNIHQVEKSALTQNDNTNFMSGKDSEFLNYDEDDNIFKQKATDQEIVSGVESTLNTESGASSKMLLKHSDHTLLGEHEKSAWKAVNDQIINHDFENDNHFNQKASEQEIDAQAKKEHDLVDAKLGSKEPETEDMNIMTSLAPLSSSAVTMKPESMITQNMASTTQDLLTSVRPDNIAKYDIVTVRPDSVVTAMWADKPKAIMKTQDIAEQPMMIDQNKMDMSSNMNIEKQKMPKIIPMRNIVTVRPESAVTAMWADNPKASIKSQSIEADSKLMNDMASNVNKENQQDIQMPLAQSPKAAEMGMTQWSERNAPVHHDRFLPQETHSTHFMKPTSMRAHDGALVHGKAFDMDFAPTNMKMNMMDSEMKSAKEAMSLLQRGPASRSYGGGYGGGYGAGLGGGLGGGLAAGGPGAVGVFPSAKSSNCAIPLLLSCSPSVVSGSLAKAHSSYGAPAYRSNEGINFHKKRDTKSINDIQSKPKRTDIKPKDSKLDKKL